jgi:hypothetical protein
MKYTPEVNSVDCKTYAQLIFCRCFKKNKNILGKNPRKTIKYVDAQQIFFHILFIDAQQTLSAVA